MYVVRCKNCGNYYESNVNREGICPDCKITVRGRTNTRYREKTYDRITLYVAKGDREVIKEYAAKHGMSTNEFVNKAIDYYAEMLEKSKKSDGEEQTQAREQD